MVPAMGNPASPSFANIVMNYIFDNVINNLNFDIPICKLYVNDSILAFPFDKVEILLNKFNTFHANIKFTHEIEINNKISFLDIILIRNDNLSVDTCWYNKTN